MDRAALTGLAIATRRPRSSRGLAEHRDEADWHGLAGDCVAGKAAPTAYRNVRRTFFETNSLHLCCYVTYLDRVQRGCQCPAIARVEDAMPRSDKSPKTNAVRTEPPKKDRPPRPTPVEKPPRRKLRMTKGGSVNEDDPDYFRK